MYAYIDDVHIVGSVDDVLAARTAFVNHLRQIELSVNLEKCSLLYFHDHTHPLTHSQLQAVRDAGLQWDADRSLYAEVLGAIIGIDAAAIARGLFVKLDGVHGLFGAFFRRVGSGGFTVQAAMLLLAHSVGRMGYLQRCLPPAALMEAAQRWNGLMVDTAQRVLNLATHELTESVKEALQRPRRLGGFGLSSAVLLSPFAFIASVAASAAQPGSHPLSVDTLPAASSLRQWLHAALTSPTVSALPPPSDTLHLSTANCVHLDADTFTGHYHSYPDQAAGQSTLMLRRLTRCITPV